MTFPLTRHQERSHHMNSMNKVLILGAHPDDIEFGMGGTLSRIQGMGIGKIRIIVFSNCDESLPSGLPAKTLINECKASLMIYGIDESQVLFENFAVRNFHQSRQEILDTIIREYRQDAYDTVFFPTTKDTHQDHSVISEEAIRACTRSTMFGYEMPWNVFDSKKNFYFEIQDKDLEKKQASIAKYSSQSARQYASAHFQESAATVAGVTIGKKYAEGFEMIRGIYSC